MSSGVETTFVRLSVLADFGSLCGRLPVLRDGCFAGSGCQPMKESTSSWHAVGISRSSGTSRSDVHARGGLETKRQVWLGSDRPTGMSVPMPVSAKGKSGRDNGTSPAIPKPTSPARAMHAWHPTR